MVCMQAISWQNAETKLVTHASDTSDYLALILTDTPTRDDIAKLYCRVIDREDAEFKLVGGVLPLGPIVFRCGLRVSFLSTS